MTKSSHVNVDPRNQIRPEFGAWRCPALAVHLGWTRNNATSAHPPLQLLFIVLPILFHRETFTILKGTNRPSGLHGFADKFSRSTVGKSDVIAGIQSRALSWRGLTWESVTLAIQSRLITLSISNGTAIPLTTASPTGVPVSIRPLLTNADKLGQWCSELSLFESLCLPG